ncbi:hypothetical protein T484DRAFT_3622409 [Baffinella frigidus]|nr:hypothetical protein T484DRAFT_3622409 [Cryptophyta sp. CCMP2293]
MRSILAHLLALALLVPAAAFQALPSQLPSLRIAISTSGSYRNPGRRCVIHGGALRGHGALNRLRMADDPPEEEGDSPEEAAFTLPIVPPPTTNILPPGREAFQEFITSNLDEDVIDFTMPTFQEQDVIGGTEFSRGKVSEVPTVSVGGETVTLGPVVRPKISMVFTCCRCETRQMKSFSRLSYEKGIVIVRCDGLPHLNPKPQTPNPKPQATNHTPHTTNQKPLQRSVSPSTRELYLHVGLCVPETGEFGHVPPVFSSILKLNLSILQVDMRSARHSHARA